MRKAGQSESALTMQNTMQDGWYVDFTMLFHWIIVP
jgi:hypothetical protein